MNKVYIKNITISIMSFILILSWPLSVCAKEISNTNCLVENSSILLERGYTSEGIYYEVYGKLIEFDKTTLNSRIIHSVEVSRQVIYGGIVTPPDNIPWSESMYGTTFSGRLELTSTYWDYTTTTTSAWYRGIIMGSI